MDVGDLDYIINWLFFGGPGPLCFLEADIDGDGMLDIADVVYLISYFWQGEPEPPGYLFFWIKPVNQINLP